jgi:hypothetical protein
MLMVLKAPLTEDIDITFQKVRFNGSLLKENIYRQEASPEVDEAWAKLGVNCKFSSDVSGARV